MNPYAKLLLFATSAAVYAAAIGWIIERSFKAFEKADPTGPDYDWGPLIRVIYSLEQTRNFVSLNWLMKTRLARNPELVEALRVALDREMLKTYKLENPKNPDHPVTACTLNRSHPQVRAVLRQDTSQS